jgi:hypothetical protein
MLLIILSQRWSSPSVWSFLCFLLILIQVGNAYRIGDIVETEVILNGVVATSSSSSASSFTLLRSQMPRFGISSTATVQIKDDKQQDDDQYRRPAIQTLALQFEDGLWYSTTVAVLDTKNNQKYPLQKIEVQILYSKSGSGAIHAINAKPVYRSDASGNSDPGSYTLEYQWIEEEAVHLGAGLSVMFVIVFAASIAFFVISCGGIMEPNGTGSSTDHQYHYPKSGFPHPHSLYTAIPQGTNNNVPKWE